MNDWKETPYICTGPPKPSDLVEVVRCKDCEYRQGATCDYWEVHVRPNGFCSWGQRKEG